MARPTHILAFRFSALGDVAMAVPIVKLLLQQYPQLQVTFVSQPFHQPLFEGIERLHFYPADIINEFKGLKGLYKLSDQLKKEISYDSIADLHDVLRTKVIRNLLKAKAVAVIDKGRKQKKELTRRNNKKLKPLKSTFARYANVFEKLGYTVELIKNDGIVHKEPDQSLLPVSHVGNDFIGIAPFAKHDAKMYPLEKMKQVVLELANRPNTHIFLFGSKTEAGIMQDWVEKSSIIHIIAGRFSFEEELNIISQIDVMVSMDSANMHLASLYGVPVVSVWGGTHPFLGFYGWAQDIDNAVQLDLPCRPSSVFGKKDCPEHGKAGCMQDITPDMIVTKVASILSK